MLKLFEDLSPLTEFNHQSTESFPLEGRKSDYACQVIVIVRHFLLPGYIKANPRIKSRKGNHLGKEAEQMVVVSCSISEDVE